MAKVFLTGGTGFIGRAIVGALGERGDEAIVLTRSVERARRVLGERPSLVEGDPVCSGDWQERLAGCTAVINLAGESLGAQRWNTRVKQIIHHSRTDSTRNVVDAIGACDKAQRPSVLVNASGIDVYPFDVDLEIDDDDDLVTEDAEVGDSFLAQVCADWEREAREAEAFGVRVVLMRSGVVTGGEGGAMERWARIFRWFIGGKIGSGRQWMSWVHIEDVVRAYLYAVDKATLEGPVNVVSPRRLRNRDMARALGRAMGRPSLFPVPGFVLRRALGEFADYLLAGRPATPAKLLASGFEFVRNEPFTASTSEPGE